MLKLLTTANAKTSKGEALGYLTGILYLAPASIGVPNICPGSSTGCRAVCLYRAGRGRFTNVQNARKNKTALFHTERAVFMQALFENVAAVERKAIREGLKPCIRLNGTSDIRYEKMKFKAAGRTASIMDHFPHIQFYDYTALPAHSRLRFAPPNYDLTFSLKEDNSKRALEAIAGQGMRVAAVYREPQEGTAHIAGEAFPVIDGDKHDLRFLDPQSCIVALKAKGEAKHDTTGFVQ